MQQCTTQEQRSVVTFLFSEGVKPIEIRRVRIQYGDRCMSSTQVYEYEWTEKFKNGVTSVEDFPRPGPAFTSHGRQHCSHVCNKCSVNKTFRFSIEHTDNLVLHEVKF